MSINHYYCSRHWWNFFAVPFLVVSLSLLTNCGSSDSSDTDPPPDEPEAGTNALAVAFPDDLAVASLTAGGAGTTSINARGLHRQVDDPTVLQPMNFQDKKEEVDGILRPANPEDAKIPEDAVNFEKGSPPMDCFGPQLFWEGDHPDGDDGTSPLPRNDLGIWTETEETTGEACPAAVMNSMIGNIENFINLGIMSAAATLGAAGLEAGAALPALGTSQDLTDEANTVIENSGVTGTMESSVLTRNEDTADGFPVFTLASNGSITLPGSDGENAEMAIEMTLEHIPEIQSSELASVTRQISVNDDTYCGRLSQKFSTPPTADDRVGMFMGEDCADGVGSTECISVTYCKDSETSLRYHMRRARFCGEDADCFDANGDVDPSLKADVQNGQPPQGPMQPPPEGQPPPNLIARQQAQDATEGWTHDFYYIVCEVDPTNGSGSCAQAWQAGAGDALTRVLNVQVNADGTGCGYYGYGPEIEQSSGEIDRMICNWVAPGGAIQTMDYTGVQRVQRQCFTQNSEGLFVSDEDDLVNITYAPTNNCNKAAGTFAYGVQEPPTDVGVNDVITNDLLDIDLMEFTVPDLPVVP